MFIYTIFVNTIKTWALIIGIFIDIYHFKALDNTGRVVYNIQVC